MNKTRWFLKLIFLLGADLLLLVVLNRLDLDFRSEWALYALVAGLAIKLWMPGLLSPVRDAALTGAAALIVSQLYLLTLFQRQYGMLSTPRLGAFVVLYAVTASGLILAARRLLLARRQMLHAVTSSHVLRVALIVGAAAFVNVVLLLYYNTLLWPYLWPKPILFIIVIVLGLMLWSPRWMYSLTAFRAVGVAMIFTGESYLLHTLRVTLDQFDALSLIHLVGFAGMYFVLVINVINQFSPRNNQVAPPLPGELPFVALVIPTYGEPYEVLEKTLISLKWVDYPSDDMVIVISDDSHRRDIQRLARKHGVQYHPGPHKDAKAGNLNSVLNYLVRRYPQTSLIVTQDADELMHPAFLKKTVGYFNDPKVAVVQTAKESSAPEGDPFGTRDRLFYDIMQPGRNGRGAALACGSGVIWRVSALLEIGGFATWNVIEDLTTTYYLHSAGYRSEYHNEVLSVGLAPEDIPGLLKQRGTWAVDTWRLILFDNPLRKPGLTLAQRLQYLELGLFYASAVFFTPLMMFTPLVSLATGDYLPIEGAALFPWVVFTLLYYVILSGGYSAYLVRTWQYWVGHWPTYTQAFFIALFSRSKKPSYKVTRKTRQSGFYGYLLWAQFLYVTVGIMVALRALLWEPETNLITQLTNVVLLMFFIFLISGICRAAFYGVDLAPWRVVKSVFQPFAGLRRKRDEVVWQSDSVTLPSSPFRSVSRVRRIDSKQ
ncbi:MAG TPA: glycosyltransferase [Aggregatilinea sp.]|uniref:glycosyltransferase n=1 Tax=Aggregatilinea sp. TaxID=2806333 RepID=UPI002D14410E|nr:glycosyltransferase [Aggregatilinea sp.]HML24442.1 glycosyltransferase [Aggregatilinea sp.]